MKAIRTPEFLRAEIKRIRLEFVGATGHRAAYLQDELEKIRAHAVAAQIIKLEDELSALASSDGVFVGCFPAADMTRVMACAEHQLAVHP